MERHVSITPIGARLRKGEAQFANDARGQPAGLDELQEHRHGRPHVPVRHQHRGVQLRQVPEVGLGETLRQRRPVPLLLLCFIRERAVV